MSDKDYSSKTVSELNSLIRKRELPETGKNQKIALLAQHDAKQSLEEKSHKRRKMLTDELTCPVCLNLCLPHVYSCLNGHQICESCSSEVKNCPQCRISLQNKARNRFAERMCEDVEVTCPKEACGAKVVFSAYQQHMDNDCKARLVPCTLGCPETVAFCKLAEHEKTCIYRPMPCPLCDSSPKFEAKTTADLVSHLMNVHGVDKEVQSQRSQIHKFKSSFEAYSSSISSQRIIEYKEKNTFCLVVAKELDSNVQAFTLLSLHNGATLNDPMHMKYLNLRIGTGRCFETTGMLRHCSVVKYTSDDMTDCHLICHRAHAYFRSNNCSNNYLNGRFIGLQITFPS